MFFAVVVSISSSSNNSIGTYITPGVTVGFFGGGGRFEGRCCGPSLLGSHTIIGDEYQEQDRTRYHSNVTPRHVRPHGEHRRLLTRCRWNSVFVFLYFPSSFFYLLVSHLLWRQACFDYFFSRKISPKSGMEILPERDLNGTVIYKNKKMKKTKQKKER